MKSILLQYDLRYEIQMYDLSKNSLGKGYSAGISDIGTETQRSFLFGKNRIGMDE